MLHAVILKNSEETQTVSHNGCLCLSLSLLCHAVDPARAWKYKQHESFPRFSTRAATPLSDRRGHNDSSASLWQQSVKFRGAPHPGRCHEFLMFTLNWKKSEDGLVVFIA